MSSRAGGQLFPLLSQVLSPRRVGVAQADLLAASETFRWVRRAVAVAVPILATNTIFTAFADNMPAFHHVAALIAVPVMVVAWEIELCGVRWPRLALIAGVIGPNVWLTLVGHIETNYLFLALLVGWVAYTGTRGEGLLAVVLAYGTITLGVILYTAPNVGAWPWEYWTEWAFTLVLTWFLGFTLRKQERLVTDLGQRSQELRMLLTVSGSVASSLEMRPLLNAVFDALASMLDYSAIAVLTLNDARTTLTLAHMRGPDAQMLLELHRTQYPVSDLGPAWDRLCRDEPVVIPDVRTLHAESGLRQFEGADSGVVRSLMWIPLVVRQQIIGILTIANATPDAFRDRDTTLALGIARQAAVAIENARLHERTRQAAVLEERQRLARELHDSVTQALYGISLYAEAADRALADGDIEPVATNLRDVRETTQEALGEMRLLIYELRPPFLEEYGLAAALRTRLKAVETRAGLVTDFESDGEDVQRLAPETEQELYRLAQEALNNVLKHAHAQRVRVRLAVDTDRTTLEVADDGVGFKPTSRGVDGFGLPGMRERAARLGGTLQVESSPGAGTRVRVEIAR
ncbi:MAG TPA: histidine kinase [Chloroflexota bacterium]|nr:histidine kinase [Chloroflexota bacterium]